MKGVRTKNGGPEPMPISFRPDVETRERAPAGPGHKGGRAFIYDIEGERLTCAEIASRLGKDKSGIAARLANGQRTWAKLRESNVLKNRAAQRRRMTAEMEGNRARIENDRNGRRKDA